MAPISTPLPGSMTSTSILLLSIPAPTGSAPLLNGQISGALNGESTPEQPAQAVFSTTKPGANTTAAEENHFPHPCPCPCLCKLRDEDDSMMEVIKHLPASRMSKVPATRKPIPIIDQRKRGSGGAANKGGMALPFKKTKMGGTATQGAQK